MPATGTPCGKPAVARVSYKDKRQQEHPREHLCSGHHAELHSGKEEQDSAKASEPPEPGATCEATW
jgi:hypothetical protein